MRAGMSATIAVAALASLMLSACALGPRAGQIVFEPSAHVGTTTWSQLPTASERLVIQTCQEEEAGLVVEGHVSDPSPVTVIQVSSTSPDVAGVRVGRLQLADMGRIGAVSGNFVVQIPWASFGSVFSLVEADRAGTRVSVRCPSG